MLKLSAPVAIVQAEEGETPRREISGIAVPWNVDAIVSDGTAVRFEPGSLSADGPAPKLIESHDLSQIRGLVVDRRPTEAGMEFTARIAATAAGNDVLELVKMGAIDSVSVGVNPTKWRYDGDTMVVEAGDWMELSLVAIPAFADARIVEIAANQPTEVLKEDTTMAEATPTPEVEASVTTNPPILYAQAARPPKLPSPGEYIAMMKRGGADWQQFNHKVSTAIQAATGDVLVSDAAGVVPVPIVAPVYDDINPLRPIVNALGTRAMPDAGATFIRPYVKVHSSVAEQSTELTALSTANFEVDDIVVTKKTFGGKLVLSEQVIDWSAPSMLDQAINDMAGQYALATENHVVSQMAAAVTNTQEVVITSFTDDEEFITDLYLAASSIATTGNYLPNAIVVSPKRWASLGALVDGQGRPVFPQVSPMSGIGNLPSGVTAWNGNPLGLQLVVSNQVKTQAVGDQDAEDYYWLLNTRGVECYESYKGFIRDESVGTLGVTIAVRGYFAAQVVDVNMIRVLGPNATFA